MGSIPPSTQKAISGLWTSVNPFSRAPEGGLVLGDDVLVRVPGVLESRRGLPPSALTIAADRMFLMPSGTQVCVTSRGGTGPSVYDPDADTISVIPRSGGNQPMAYPYQSDPRTSLWAAAATGLLYLAGQQGLACTDGSTWRAGGMPRPAWNGGDGATCQVYNVDQTYGPLNWANNTRRAYRLTLAWYDSAGNFHESEPSEAVYLDNTVGGPAIPLIALKYPPGTPMGSFFRVWRALEVAAGASWSDEMFLVREVIDSSQVAGPDGYVSTTATPALFGDVSIDSLLNVPLYTNPQTGDGFGILSANSRPPAAAVIAQFKGRMYFGRPTYQQTLEVQVIGTSTTAGNSLLPGDTLTIDGTTYVCAGDSSPPFAYAALYSLIGGPVANTFWCVTHGTTVSNNIELTARSLVEAVNYNARRRIAAGYPLTRVVCAYYASSGVNDFGRVVLYRPIPTPVADDPRIPFSVITASGGIRFPQGLTTSTDSYLPGGLAWSKPNQPESVPAINFTTVGDPNKAILGFAVLRDSLVIFKEDGSFILYDQGGPQPVIQVLDPTINPVAPQTISVMNNAAYLLSARGALRVTEQNTEAIGDAIRVDLLDLLAANRTDGAVAWGCAYQTENLFIFGVPSSASENGCSLQYVYNEQTKQWQRWTKAGTLAGLVSPSDKLLMAYSIALPPGNVVTGWPATSIYVERKGGVASVDYTDLIGGLPAATYAAARFSTPPAGAPPTVVTRSTLTYAQDMHLQVGEGDLLLFRYTDTGDGKTRDQWVRVTGVSGAVVSTDSLTRVSPDGTSLMGRAPTYYRAIPCHWRYLPQALGEPSVEKQWNATQTHFDYIDGDWFNLQIDTEKSGPRTAQQVALDPQIANTSAAIGSVRWLRSTRNVVLRMDPAVAEARGAVLGVECRFNQARSSFRLVSASAHTHEFKERSTR